jgi:hypothetical protein
MLHIYTVCYNTPDFIEYQYQQLKKHITEDFTYYVFNNTNTDTVITHNNTMNNHCLISTCNALKIKLYDVPVELFHSYATDPSTRAGIAIDYATKFLVSHIKPNSKSSDDTMFLLDADAFLITPFDVTTFMTNVVLSGRDQYRIDDNNNMLYYITNQLVIFKPFHPELEPHMDKLSFMPATINGAACDCGGNIHQIMDLKVSYRNWSNILFSADGNIYQRGGHSPNLAEHFQNYKTSSNLNLDLPLKQYIEDDTTIIRKTYPFCEIFSPDVCSGSGLVDSNIMFLHLRAGTNWINFDIRKRKHLLFTFLKQIK